MPWSHEAVYRALVGRGEREKASPVNRYVVLYQQKPICAVLYSPDSRAAAIRPVHLNPARESWRPVVFAKIRESIRLVGSDSKGPGKAAGNFDRYEVLDWNGLARGLGL
jgi:hypothetical protein